MQAGTVVGHPEAGDGHVEMIRTLRLARRSATKACSRAANQVHALVMTTPDDLRARLRALPMAELVRVAAAAKLALKGLAPSAIGRSAPRSMPSMST